LQHGTGIVRYNLFKVTKPQAVIAVATFFYEKDGELVQMVTKPQAVIAVATQLLDESY